MLLVKLTILVAAILCTGHASPIPIWSPFDCANVSTNFDVPSAGGSFEAIGCMFQNTITEILLPTSPFKGTAAASVLVSNGWVGTNFGGPNIGISFVGPSNEVAALLSPILINVTGMHFIMSSVLQFSGSLPPSSEVSISGNSFAVYTLATADYPKWFISSISLGNTPTSSTDAAKNSISLTKGSKFSITNNQFQITIWNQGLAAINILYELVSVSEGSVLNISSNSMEDSQSVGSAFDTAGQFYLVNWALNTFGEYVSPMAAAVSNKSIIEISNNSFAASTLEMISENSRTVTSVINIALGNAYAFSSESSLVVSDDSSMAINGNFIANSSAPGSTLTSTTSAVAISVSNSGISVVNGSIISVSGNYVKGVVLLNCIVLNWHFESVRPVGVTLSNGSTILMNNNFLWNPTATPQNVLSTSDKTTVISWQAMNCTLTLSDSHFVVSGNTMRNLTFGLGSTTYFSIFNLYIKTIFTQGVSLSNSSFNITSNAVKDCLIRNFGTVRLAMLTFVGAPLTLQQNSTVLISANQLQSVTVSASVSYPSLFPMVVYFGLDQLRMSGGSLLALNDNQIADALVWYAMTVSGIFFNAYNHNISSLESNESFITMDNNAVLNSVVDEALILVTMAHSDGAALIINSTVSMSGNAVDAATILSDTLQMCAWKLQFTTVQISDNSTIQVNKNTMMRTPFSSPFGDYPSSFLYFYTSVSSQSMFIVTKGSTISVSGNYVDGLTGYLTVVQFDGVPTITVSNNSTFEIELSNITMWGQFNAFITSSQTTLYILPSASLVVKENIASFGGANNSSLLTVGSLSLGGLLELVRNVISQPDPAITGGTFQFAVVQRSLNVPVYPQVVVVACYNNVSWDADAYNYPTAFLSPPSLASSSFLCVQTEPSVTEPSGSVVVIGAVVGSIAAVVLVVAVVLFVRRRRGKVPNAEPLMSKENDVQQYCGMQ